MELEISGEKSSRLEVRESVFGSELNEALIHQVVTAILSNGRSYTKAQKTRAEVRGGGIKPFRQKGTGRARAGTIRSPLWRKGGVVFASKFFHRHQKINKKMYRGALRSVISELIRQNKVVIVNSVEVNSSKTKELLKNISAYLLDQQMLIVITEVLDNNIYLAARNVVNIDVRDVSTIDPVCLMTASRVVITVPAIKKIEELLA
jgi:large subunit ribosomal protein L4